MKRDENDTFEKQNTNGKIKYNKKDTTLAINDSYDE